MEAQAAWGIWGAVAQIVVLDLLLSGDNAVVIALACRELPAGVRGRAIVMGTAAAVVMRVLMTLAAAILLQIPYFKLVGGLLLLGIGIDLARGSAHDPHGGARKAGADLWRAVTIIVVADTIMSLDNVVGVAAAARGNIALLVFGLALSIPILVFASTRLIAWLERNPRLVLAGAALLGWVAGDVAVSDPAIADTLNSQSFGLAALAPVLGAAYVLLQARLAPARRRASVPVEPPAPEARPASAQEARVAAPDPAVAPDAPAQVLAPAPATGPEPLAESEPMPLSAPLPGSVPESILESVPGPGLEPAPADAPAVVRSTSALDASTPVAHTQAAVPGELPKVLPRPTLRQPGRRITGMDFAMLAGAAVPLVGLILMILYFVWSAVAPR